MIDNSVCGLQGLSTYGVNEEDYQAATNSNGDNFLYNLSVLKEKVQQAESLAAMFIGKCSDQSTDEVIASNMGALIQEIIVTASSLMFTCQHISLGLQATPSLLTNNHHHHNRPVLHHENGGNHLPVELYGDGYINCNVNSGYLSGREVGSSKRNGEIVELDAADLLAKYTHYCQVCGKGFKRDANLRMHMRAHGDEYKSHAALRKSGDDRRLGEKYSCPEEGCRFNKKHPKFQPLKSMICVKNHYKRCHCPKMYVCKICNSKRFSVLSDLRTHEKHCGDLKWMCSCGNSFSRKDKLLGHLALFLGHSPAPTSLVKMGKRYAMIKLQDK